MVAALTRFLSHCQVYFRKCIEDLKQFFQYTMHKYMRTHFSSGIINWHTYIKEAFFSGINWHKYIEEAFFSGIGMSTLRKHFFYILT